jgi:rRNA maturation protein Nop10
VSEAPQQQTDIPVFSERLDTLMAAMIEGEAPNVGRFCGYCYTPLGKKADACSHCGRTTSRFEPVAKIPSDFFDLYRRMRKRESLVVNSFAFAGLGLGLILFIVLVAIAVYRFNQSLWMLAAATAVLIVGGRVFAGLLGGWIGDSIGYDFAHRRLVAEWTDYEREREERLGRAPARAGGAPSSTDAAPSSR